MYGKKFKRKVKGKKIRRAEVKKQSKDLCLRDKMGIEQLYVFIYIFKQTKYFLLSLQIRDAESSKPQHYHKKEIMFINKHI